MPPGDRKGAKIVNAEFVSSKVLNVRWLSEKGNTKGNVEIGGCVTSFVLIFNLIGVKGNEVTQKIRITVVGSQRYRVIFLPYPE